MNPAVDPSIHDFHPDTACAAWPPATDAPRRVTLSTLAVSAITTSDALERLVPEWTGLFHASATANPFAHPLWLAAWARHFVATGDLYVVTARDATGALVAVAPFYRLRRALGPGPAATALQLLGSGRPMDPTELAQALIRPGLERVAWRAIMAHLCGRVGEWDWIEVVLPPEQGWFEPQWLPRHVAAGGGFALHKATRACVMLPLPSSWDDLRAGLKRNVRESLRRGVNSLAREGRGWEVTAPAGAHELPRALDDLMALHHARAGLPGKVRHPDLFADARNAAFLREVAGVLHGAGALTPYVLRVGGEAAAARLMLHANGAAFFSVSGLDPRWWRHNVATTLVAALLRDAVARGDALANLSCGPDVAKLRWGGRLDLHQEFLVVGPRRRSRLAFALYWQLRAADLLRRESRRQQQGE